MKGFKDSTKMMHGHNFARGGHTMQAHFPQIRPAHGAPAQAQGKIEGTTAHGSSPDGNSAVMRSPVQPTQELTEHGGKTPLTSGYKKGGGFHVHKHYHMGGKVKTVSKSYSGFGGSMQSSKKAGSKTRNGGFPSGSTGNTRNKLKKGGPTCMATGGTRNKFATGGTRNPVAKGGKMHIKPE